MEWQNPTVQVVRDEATGFVRLELDQMPNVPYENRQMIEMPEGLTKLNFHPATARVVARQILLVLAQMSDKDIPIEFSAVQ
jgi:hypothetical protein